MALTIKAKWLRTRKGRRKISILLRAGALLMVAR